MSLINVNGLSVTKYLLDGWKFVLVSLGNVFLVFLLKWTSGKGEIWGFSIFKFNFEFGFDFLMFGIVVFRVYPED